MGDAMRTTSVQCFFFNDTATTEIYTLSLHDALPICDVARVGQQRQRHQQRGQELAGDIATHLDGAVRQLREIGVDGSFVRDFETPAAFNYVRSEEHTSELQAHSDIVCRLLLERKKNS